MVVASIVIPTYRRPQTLVPAIRSCLGQGGDDPYEVVVVDNNPDGSARDAVAALAAESAVPIRYISEPRPGISHARNAGVAAASGRYLVFLDDDQEAAAGWLVALLQAIRKYQAAVVFGRILPRFPVPLDEVPAFAQRKFTRDEQIANGAAMPARSPLLGSPGISNTVVDSRELGAEPFDLVYGFAGGEDTLLFREMLQRGRPMVWCGDALAYEEVPAARLSADYLLRRAFNNGQVSAATWGSLHPPAHGKMILVMLAGVVQASLFALPALATWLCRHPRRLSYSGQVAAGIGKVLCSPGWLLPIYRPRQGSAAAPAQQAKLPTGTAAT